MYEYKVIPAPTKGKRGRGVKGAEARFANAIEDVLIKLGAEGWEYQRAETLPSTERSGLTGSTTQWRHVLIFRRAIHIQEIVVEVDPQPDASTEPVAPEEVESEKVEPDEDGPESEETEEHSEREDDAGVRKGPPPLPQPDKSKVPEPPSQGSKLSKVMSAQASKSNDNA